MPSDPKSAPKRSLVSLFWIINLALAAGIAGWILLDARFEASVDWFRYHTFQSGDDLLLRDMGDWWWLKLRNTTTIAIASVALVSNLLMFAGLAMGSRWQRSITSWLLATSLVAIWLALALHWEDVAWIGKRYRIERFVRELAPIAENLNRDWPRCDGEREPIGPFMAYPASSPRTLILLTLPELQSGSTTFGVVEGGRGIVRFELVGVERGDWLEWHPSGTEPESFWSGLGEHYQLDKSQSLDNQWFLVRYQFSDKAVARN